MHMKPKTLTEAELRFLVDTLKIKALSKEASTSESRFFMTDV